MQMEVITSRLLKTKITNGTALMIKKSLNLISQILVKKHLGIIINSMLVSVLILLFMREKSILMRKSKKSKMF